MKLSIEELKESRRSLTINSNDLADVLDELIAIREMKGEQVPKYWAVVSGYSTEFKHSRKDAEHYLNNVNGMFIEELFTAPQKLVVCFGDIAIHENLPIVGALVSYKDVVELIEAAGGIVKDGE